MRGRKLPVMLSIAGSDNTGGAGIQADIKTACAYGVYAATAITAVTAQNSTGVRSACYVGDELLRNQLDTFFEEYHPDAVKIGMIPDPGAAVVIAEVLREHKAGNIVLDPVLFSTTGHSLSGKSEQTARAIAEELFPLTTLITPNRSEMLFFASLSTRNPAGGEGVSTDSPEHKLMADWGVKALLVTGGEDDPEVATDTLYRPGTPPLAFSAPKIESRNTHGTGCTFSSAIACALALGSDLEEAIRKGKEFVSKAIEKGARFTVTDSRGPLCFF